MSVYEKFISQLETQIQQQSLVKLSLGNYHGVDADLKQVIGKLVLIKTELRISVIFRYKTKDITKNYFINEFVDLLATLLGYKGFRSMHALYQHGETQLQMNKKAEWKVTEKNIVTDRSIDLQHDKQKERKLKDSNQKYLHSLNLTDAEGEVYKNAQHKWKQINHYIDLLSQPLQELPKTKKLQIVDMGAGKGYLTFALYDYLQRVLNRDVEVVGVEYRKDLVDFCNQVALDAGFLGLKFKEGSIEGFVPEQNLDVLIALHACDTATDDAIFKGIEHQASLIVVAPCCHKQIRRELERIEKKNDLDFMIQYGIFLERHAEMLTDSIRSLILEYFGYETKVMQFISDQHTPKNVMIVASKKTIDSNKQQEILAKLKQIKHYFGIEKHHLEVLCQLDTLS
ncbi:class I SAM-dependent methyltransferase [Sphingobacterium sp. HJSM2_6]|uniref:class I SAM-dependent methyltransferase n=1 Tax=Sphingobacterium sp. HJSM2_6 TaxID=3366264 RepID=UPI003BBF5215